MCCLLGNLANDRSEIPLSYCDLHHNPTVQARAETVMTSPKRNVAVGVPSKSRLFGQAAGHSAWYRSRQEGIHISRVDRQVINKTNC